MVSSSRLIKRLELVYRLIAFVKPFIVDNDGWKINKDGDGKKSSSAGCVCGRACVSQSRGSTALRKSLSYFKAPNHAYQSAFEPDKVSIRFKQLAYNCCPTLDLRLTNVSVVRLKKDGKRFEVSCLATGALLIPHHLR